MSPPNVHAPQISLSPLSANTRAGVFSNSNVGPSAAVPLGALPGPKEISPFAALAQKPFSRPTSGSLDNVALHGPPPGFSAGKTPPQGPSTPGFSSGSGSTGTPKGSAAGDSSGASKPVKGDVTAGKNPGATNDVAIAAGSKGAADDATSAAAIGLKNGAKNPFAFTMADGKSLLVQTAVWGTISGALAGGMIAHSRKKNEEIFNGSVEDRKAKQAAMSETKPATNNFRLKRRWRPTHLV